MNSPRATSIAAHSIYTFDDIIFSSNFDNGNLGKVERTPNKPYEFKVWTAPDNMGTEYQSKHCAWFHFVVSGLPLGCVLRIQIVNASNHSGLYKYDMRPVYKCNSTGQKWMRIKSSVRFNKDGDTSAQLFFEHGVDSADDKIYFAFTYPYSYNTLQGELAAITHENDLSDPNSLFYQRELLTLSRDGRRVDLLTITSVDGYSPTEQEPLLPGMFPDSPSVNRRPPVFPHKEIMFISARVHPGEVPAQHTFKGILALLLDKEDKCAKELRARYVFKLIPMLNPDGVYRGHFRMDQLGQNLNRYYCNPDASLQPSIFAAKSLMDYYAANNKLAVYLDFHAHASKRGCFIYGNVLDSVEDQIQNQLYCKLISMNSAHFDYEGCLFSKEHMFRTDPGDQAKGLTAEGSGRVWTYLAHGIIHSYTIECNYNTSKVGNEIAAPDIDPGGSSVTPASNFTTNPEKYTPTTYAGVGRACVLAILDLKGHNPCSRVTKSKMKTLERVRNVVMMEVRNKKEFLGKPMNRERKRLERKAGSEKGASSNSDEIAWRRVVETAEPVASSNVPSPAFSTSGAHNNAQVLTSGSAKVTAKESGIIFIPGKERRRRRTLSGAPLTSSAVDPGGEVSNRPSLLVPTPPLHHRVASSDELLHGSNADNSNISKLANFFSGARKASLSGTHAAGGIACTESALSMHLETLSTGYTERQRSTDSKLNSNVTQQHPQSARYSSYQLSSGGSDHKEFRPIADNQHDSDGHDDSSTMSLRMKVRGQSASAVSNSFKSSPTPQQQAQLSSSGMPPPIRRTNLSPAVTHKDNRKILSKALNPAGIALLMAGSSVGSHCDDGGGSSPHVSLGALPDVLVSGMTSKKELVASKDKGHFQHSLPDIRKVVSSDDMAMLSSVSREPYSSDSSAALNKLVEATLLPGNHPVVKTSRIPARPTEANPAAMVLSEGDIAQRKFSGSYSIKTALQLSSSVLAKSNPPGAGANQKLVI